MNSTRENIHNNQTILSKAESGYDLPLFGFQTGQFYRIHIIGIICIILSLISVIAIVISSFVSKDKFLKRSQSRRLVVYLALCDGIFNVLWTTRLSSKGYY